MYIFTEHGPEEILRRQNTYNGYGLPPVAPRMSPGSGHRIGSRPGSGDSVNNAAVCYYIPTKNRKFLLFLNLTEIKFKIWSLTYLESFLPQRSYGMDFRFSRNNGNIECALHLK